MRKLTEEQLKNWLDSDEYMISQEGSSEKDQLYKIPLNDDFTILFYKHISKENSFALYKDLKNVGLYYKQDGCIYSPHYYLKSMCEDMPMIKEHTDKPDFAEQLTAAVRDCVEKVIDNNVNNLSRREISDEWELRQVAQFIEYTAYKQARSLFLSDTDVSDISYHCTCTCSELTDTEYLQFIVDKVPLIELKAAQYIRENQDEILAQFYENAAVKNELQKIYDGSEDVLNQIKAIMKAVEESGAKTVNVTINKDDKDFTFKYETRTLKIDPESYYSSYYMKASDRREFENLFGRNAVFLPNEITQITYGRNVIYDSSEFDTEETEDTAMVQTM